MPHLHSRTRSNQPAHCAIVVGGGISGLVAAKDLAAAGYGVTVLEASGAFGGCVGVHSVAGLRLDSGAESFATRNTAVAELATELGLGAQLTTPDPAGAWVRLPSGPIPLPRTGILGIPADPWAPEVRQALGFAGSLRASMDARMSSKVGTTAEVCSVAELVRARMGEKVLERLVAPVVGGVHSADPEILDVDMVAPGLRQGIREHGSLAAAVAAQRQASAEKSGQDGSAKPGSAVGGLAGGMNTLVTALVTALRSSGVELHMGHPATAISRIDDAGSAARWRVTAGEWWADAAVLVVATDGPAAVKLLRSEMPELEPFAPAPGPDVRLVTLVVDLPELDTKPRGTGILVAPHTPGITAKALTHATAKWQWLADEAGPGTHVLRLSYGRAGTDPVRLESADSTEQSRNEQLLESALADATALLELTIGQTDVLGWDVVRWQGALPFAAVGHRAKMAQLRELAAGQPGLLLTGGWLAGNGLAAVVADARAQVRQLLEPAGDPAVEPAG